MRKIVISLLLTLCTITYASKVLPIQMTFLQPDGTELNVFMHGDANFCWYTTADNILLQRTESAFFIADIKNGDIHSTNIIAHNKELRSIEENKLIASVNRDAVTSYIENNQETAMAKKISLGTSSVPYFGHSGSPKALVILVEYSDLKFILPNPKEQYEQFFNNMGSMVNMGNNDQRNFGSVKKYFSDSSDGQFTPDFVVAGPVTIGNMSTYGGNSATSSAGENVNQMAIDAISKLNTTDFSQFDNNNDGRLDMVVLIYAGYSQNQGGPANSVWAQTSYSNSTVNGTKLGWYTCTSELAYFADFWAGKTPYINGIGVACHEISHAMGLPDIYPTTSSAYKDNQEMEYWDLMDGGEYVYNGYSPRPYTAWEREVMGWSSIEPLTTSETSITMTPVTDGGKAYKFCNPAKAEEYIVIENIQNTNWDKRMPGHGMLAYHVAWNESNVTHNQHPNNVVGKPTMAIIPADGACLSSYISANNSNYQASHAGDTFPGSTGLTNLNKSLNLPNFKWYNGTADINQALTNITEDETVGTVTFDYITDYQDYLTGISDVQSNNAHDIFDLLGRKVNTDMTKKGVYIIQGKKHIVR